MSLYVEWLNRIKAKATCEWLTDGQREAYKSIVSRWQSQRFVCLCGPPGSGKSFMARLLAKEHGYVYAQDLQDVQPGEELVVLDDADYTRLMRPMVQALGIRRLVLVMRRPPQDPMPKAEISLSERDVKQFQHNLTRHGVVQAFVTNSEGTDLGLILRNEAIERGKTHAAQ